MFNQKCFRFKNDKVNLCGTKTCKTLEDCYDIGNILNGVGGCVGRGDRGDKDRKSFVASLWKASKKVQHKLKRLKEGFASSATTCFNDR